MNVGIVSYWFNRGQATVGRQIRSIFDDLGHRTFVLARPTSPGFVYSNFVATDDAWDQPGVTRASASRVPGQEYVDWVTKNDIGTAFFDQNYQFAEIARLRSMGVRTVGRFVWEDFAADHVAAAGDAFDVIYSLTRCEQERYRELGIDSPYVRWGCHPEMESFRLDRENRGRSFLYIGGFMSTRKPTLAAVAAFHELADPNLEFVIKAQRPLAPSDFVIPETMSDVGARRRAILGNDDILRQDPRIRVVTDDLPLVDYMKMFAQADVSVAPSRWEGLGVHLFEAQSLGVPTISCNIPPINEIIQDGVNGLLVPCRPIGTRKNGLTAYQPSVAALGVAMSRLSDPHLARDLAEGTAEVRRARRWEFTRDDYASLLSL